MNEPWGSQIGGPEITLLALTQDDALALGNT